MNDPFLTRDWADNHERFSGDLATGLGRVWRTLTASLAVLHRYEFDAPWKHPATERRSKPCGPASA